MSVIAIEDVKRYLRVPHGYDDLLLQMLIDSAEEEAIRYLNRETLPRVGEINESPCDESSSEDSSSSEVDLGPVSPVVIEGVILLIKASYEATTPAEMAGYRQAAETKLHPYRVCLGV